MTFFELLVLNLVTMSTLFNCRILFLSAYLWLWNDLIRTKLQISKKAISMNHIFHVFSSLGSLFAFSWCSMDVTSEFTRSSMFWIKFGCIRLSGAKKGLPHEIHTKFKDLDTQQLSSSPDCFLWFASNISDFWYFCQ